MLTMMKKIARKLLRGLGNTLMNQQASAASLTHRWFEKPLFWKTVVSVYGVIFLAIVLLNIFGSPVDIFGEEYGLGTLVFYALILYTAMSLRTIGPTDLGCRLFFEKPIGNVSSGLTFVPPIICDLVTETRLVTQDEIPAEPEKIYRGSVDDEVGKTVPKELQAVGMKPPIRITFSGRNEASIEMGLKEDDPYDRRLTAEVVPVIRWRIDDFKTFLETIGSVERARKQMEDTCVKTFTEVLTKVSPAVAMLRIKECSEALQKAIEDLVNGWGIEIENAQIKAINFTQTLNAAVQNVVVQERGKVAKKLEGEGLGSVEKAVIDGRTDGFKKMVEDLGVSSEAVIGAETARAIAGEGDKSSQRTIITGTSGFTDLIGVAAAVGESLRPRKES